MKILLITVVRRNNFTIFLKHCGLFIIGVKFPLSDSHLNLELVVFWECDAGHDLNGELVLLRSEVHSSCVDFGNINVTHQKHGLVSFLCIDLHENAAFPKGTN